MVKVGVKILIEEMDEQILPDGGHFERSINVSGIGFGRFS